MGKLVRVRARENLFYDTYLAERRAARRDEREDMTLTDWRFLGDLLKRRILIDLARQSVRLHIDEQQAKYPYWGA